MKWLLTACLCVAMPALAQNDVTTLKAGALEMQIESRPLRYKFAYEGHDVFSSHPGGGLRLAGAEASVANKRKCGGDACTLDVTTELGGKGVLTIALTPHHAV